jgi:hypothetical protein
MHLPTHGLLRKNRTSAIIITPSCDLSNRKVSTVTYLPVISFLEWVSCRDFLPEVNGSMASLAEQLSSLALSPIVRPYATEGTEARAAGASSSMDLNGATFGCRTYGAQTGTNLKVGHCKDERWRHEAGTTRHEKNCQLRKAAATRTRRTVFPLGKPAGAAHNMRKMAELRGHVGN